MAEMTEAQAKACMAAALTRAQEINGGIHRLRDCVLVISYNRSFKFVPWGATEQSLVAVHQISGHNDVPVKFKAVTEPGSPVTTIREAGEVD